MIEMELPMLQIPTCITRQCHINNVTVTQYVPIQSTPVLKVLAISYYTVASYWPESTGLVCYRECENNCCYSCFASLADLFVMFWIVFISHEYHYRL